MDKWKLIRQHFGSEEYEINDEKDVTLGRGINNTITISSIVISRNHCVFKLKDNEVTVTDLKSSNGIYVGLKRIPPNIPYPLSENDIIGLGWTVGAALSAIDDNEKYVFKLVKEKANIPIKNRIQFQNEDEITESKSSLKRKLSLSLDRIKKEKNDDKNEFICVLSDSDSEENKINAQSDMKKVKLEQEHSDNIKTENDELQYDAFTIKQEYLGHDDDEPIQIDSDSDTESQHWYLRLSQSSPGKPFIKIPTEKPRESSQENSYSQWDDGLPMEDDEDIYLHDLITIPPEPPKSDENIVNQQHADKEEVNTNSLSNNLDVVEKIPPHLVANNKVDGILSNDIIPNLASSKITSIAQNEATSTKAAQLIDPLCKPSRRKSKANQDFEIKHKSKHDKDSKTTQKSNKSTSKRSISNSQKEERKRKLKEIANKEKETGDSENSSNNTHKAVVNIKITNSNRGAFLSNVVHATIKPMKKKSADKTEETNKSVKKSLDKISIPPEQKEKQHKDETKVVKAKSKRKSRSDSSKSKNDNKTQTKTPAPIKTIRPLMEIDPFSFSGKPVSKVEPLPTNKTKKKVRFSDVEPEVHVFEIEPGNRMKEIKSIKTSLVDARQMPIFSLEKLTLMKILRWNPHWLDEQTTNNEPPPILGHNNTPMAIFHSFNSHKQYIQLVGDLLLMEIWECLTQGHMRTRNQTKLLQMRIENLPPVPPLERSFELFNLSVNISMPTTDTKSAPRVGDVLRVEFGPEQAKNFRFFFVHNVRTLPAPPNNKNTFFSISLYTTFTERMKFLKPGELLLGRILAYINKELMLFEAMEYLSGSPLSEAILKPEPQHFMRYQNNPAISMNSEWIASLNESQKRAVVASVSAALGDKPSIQMVQGPPGTGKSRVICSMVMSYFYDANGKRQQNRGKILICATSNAAVDELVIRLLNIRQSLPKQERFRMVRVGRVEAMHSRARDVSSQQLAHRDAARLNAEPAHAALAEEISHLEAKINMWRTAEREAKDPVRVAYCQGRVANIVNRINLIRNNGGGSGEELRPDRLIAAERRIIDCADIIATTLSSAQNNKMRGVRGRIALCVVDEAGQAIEPETLAPLTLHATRLTLVGDPQQLPGFICSQRAKKHGLGESLFARLTSCAEHWNTNPVVLLNQQYRMHPDIADYPNRAFYDRRILSVPRPPVDWNVPPYMIVGISSGDKGQGSSGANEMEAVGVSRLAAALSVLTRARSLSLAVITPYAAHRDLIKKFMRQLDASECAEVNTVDSFQGQERDVVVVSLARSHGLGFLADAGRMNVLLTRARHALLVCLNPLAVTKNHQWRTLLEDSQQRRLYTNLPNKMCRMPSSGQNDDDILQYICNKRRK
ncbi:probable helicase senataxin [Colias croceus]|uniref:probable helicase senataxin n=1 Tax=Colias crocea TaxID=72248 RepID=UPI001E27EE95|nr:probable helicase senataxin [Colias croceus]